MDPITIAAIVGGGLSSGFKLFQGIRQKREAARLQEQILQAEQGRPEYQRPEQVDEIVSMLSAAYGDKTVPGQTTAQDRADLAQMNAIGAGVQGGNPFASLPAASARRSATEMDIMDQAARVNLQDLQNLLGGLEMQGQAADLEWQMNEFAPWKDQYQRLLAERRDVVGASDKNIFGALDDMASIGINIASMNAGVGQTPIDMDALNEIAGMFSQQQPSADFMEAMSVYSRMTGL